MREGYGISFGAISVLNAIPCGLGATIGIKLKTEAYYNETDETRIILAGRPGLADDLARTCVNRTLERLGKHDVHFTLTIVSEIPHSVGLKSSSSVCNAVISAVLDAYDISWDEMEIVKLGVKCARECGVTVTGAMDDACGCMFGGLSITNNVNDRVVLRKSVPKYDVVILLPKNGKRAVNAEDYKRYSAEYDELVPLVEKNYLDILSRNGRCMSEILGMKLPDPVPGALAVGVSGTGPAITIVAERGKGKEIAEKFDCEKIVTETITVMSFSKAKIEGRIHAPPSKSYTHRAIIMGALSGGKCTVVNPLVSKDIEATIRAVESCGAKVVKTERGYEIDGTELHAPSETIDVGNSGTTMRFMIGVASLFDSEVSLDGDESIRKRPVGPLLEALEECGVTCSSANGYPPVTVKGPLRTKRIAVDTKLSSQFASSLLMISPLVGNEIDFKITGEIVSKPYISMTKRMMYEIGIEMDKVEGMQRIYPGRYPPFTYVVPGDFSSAANIIVAGALGGKATVDCLDFESSQADTGMKNILERSGCRTDVDNYYMTSYESDLKAIEVDLKDSPDLFPIVAVLLSTAKGTSRMYGGPQLRLKESDRISTTVGMLRSLCANVEETQTGCYIDGVDELRGGFVEHHGDHRIMMAAAVASLKCRGPVKMDDDGCWEISYPRFIDDLRSLGLKVNVLDR